MAAEMKPGVLLELIRSLVALLADAGEDFWSRRLSSIQDTLSESQGDDERDQIAVREILSLYGGMGSLQDVVLQDSRGVRQEQQEFMHLRDRLFEEARAGLR